MNFKNMYMKGINLGGWLSQYGKGLKIGDSHFDTFITEEDIKRIAGWGLDHLRLPVDYMILESDDSPGVYDENGLAYIDNCIAWCKKYKLNMIIDLHHAPGFSFGSLDTNTLFTDSAMQQRMTDIWINFSKRYIDEGENLCFELLNEIVEPDSTRWNALAKKIVAAIREIDTKRVILIGGNHYNSVRALKDIDIIPDDDRIVYNFHFYEPMLFTHQMASWNRINMDYGLRPVYPSVFPEVKEFMERFPEYSPALSRYADIYVDIDKLREDLQPAKEFMEATGKILYCGEYGVIDTSDIQSRRKWHSDFNNIMDELGICRAAWSYKLMNFKFVEMDGSVADPELVDIISR